MKFFRHGLGHCVSLEQYEELRKRYADGLEAWRANNAWHARRIGKLEEELAREKSRMDNWTGTSR